VVALAVAALVWASHMRGATAHDLVALGELAAVLAVSVLAGEAFRRAALVAFLVVGGWVWFLGPPAPEPIPTELLTRASSGMSNRTPFGAASIALEMNPIQSRVRDMILSPGRLDESLLWLRAMAAGVVLSDDGRKFDGALERLNEQAGWSLYGLPDPNPAPVVVVSRHQWMNLPPIRGLHDFEGLEQYIAWAGRPEAASFRPLGGGSIEVRGDLGPLDMFLIRRNCQPGWRAYRETPTRQELAIECDPLGFMAVDPGREGETVEGETVGGEPVGGETVLRLEFRPSWTQRLFPEGMAPRPLPGGDFPRITPGGVIEATRFHPPPFRPGALLSIFGQHFASASTQVLFGEIPGELVWAGPQQINVRLPESVSPGELNVVVESAGRRSFAEPIEVEQ
jgi:hypothetical protein